MKRYIVAFYLAISMIGLSGCGQESAEKAAEKIENRAEEGDQLALQGVKEYKDADSFINKLANGEIPVNAENVDEAVAKLNKSKATLLASRAKYQSSLDIHEDNRDRVKLLNKEVLHQAIQNIDRIVKDIDGALATLTKLKKKM